MTFAKAVARTVCPKCKRDGRHLWTCSNNPATGGTRVWQDDELDVRLGPAKLRAHVTCGNCYGSASVNWRPDDPSEIQVFCLDCTAPKIPMHDLLEFGEAVKRERDR